MKYPAHFYFSVEPGRVILRRGHVGFNFYFIFSGSVFVNIEDINIEGKRFEKTETVLARGDSFGVSYSYWDKKNEIWLSPETETLIQTEN